MLTFGAFVPQGFARELAGIEGAAARWETTLEMARRVEDLGYDALWVYDHFRNVPAPAGAAVFECWTTLGALSQHTHRVRLGHVVSCNSYRQPSVVAKMAATVDVLSGGRLDLALVAGVPEDGHGGAWAESPASDLRVAMLEEAVEIVRTMWTQAETTFDGTFFRTAAARCDPGPRQEPHPPLWMGGGADDGTLGVVARHADVALLSGAPSEWQRTATSLAARCRDEGRDPDRVATAWAPELLVRGSDAEVDSAVAALAEAGAFGGDAAAWRDANLVGTPEQVAEKVDAYRRMGCGAFVPWCADFPSAESLERFATEVVPRFRSSTSG